MTDGVLFLPLQPPSEGDRNGVIIRYDIYYRQTDSEDEEEEEEDEEAVNSTSDPRPFFKAEHTPRDPLAMSHSTRLGGLRGGQRYQVKIRGATSVGAGPNSTVVTADTLERELIYCTLHVHVAMGSCG